MQFGKAIWWGVENKEEEKKEVEKDSALPPVLSTAQKEEDYRLSLIELVEYLVESEGNEWIQYFTFGRELGDTGNDHL